MTKKVLVNLTDEMHATLQKISKTEDKVVSAIIRRAIAEHLTREYGIELPHQLSSKQDDE
jgi:predicted transcriptional regulator